MTARPASAGRILAYQANRTLDNVPGYIAGLQLRLSDGRRVYLARSRTEFAVYIESDLALHYDLEGRLTKIATPHEYRRRSLSHRILQTRKLVAENGGGIVRAVLPSEVADAMVVEAHRQMRTIQGELAGSLLWCTPANTVCKARYVFNFFCLYPFSFFRNRSRSMIWAFFNTNHLLNLV